MKSTLIYSSLFLIFSFVSFTNAQGTFKNRDLPNFYQVSANLFRGAQPTEAGVEQLARKGVKTIIDLRGDDEKAKEEDLWAQKANIKFINIPLNNLLKPKGWQIKKILSEINKAENQPIFVHCKRGADRTGTVVAVYRMTHDGWTAKQAKNEAKQFGFGWWQFLMKDYINDYYSDFKKK